MPGGFLAALNAGSDNFNHQHAQQQSQNSFGISTQQQENQPVRQLGLTWSNMKQGLDSYGERSLPRNPCTCPCH